MTREEAKAILKGFMENPLYSDIPKVCRAFDMAIKALEQESRKGHWVTKPHVYGATYCSECDFELKIDDTNYCPNCGAKMIESQESEDEE